MQLSYLRRLSAALRERLVKIHTASLISKRTSTIRWTLDAKCREKWTEFTWVSDDVSSLVCSNRLDQFRDRIYDIDEETDVDEEDSLASDKTVNYCIAHDVHEDEKQKFLELSFSGLIRPCPLSAINVVNGSRLKNFDMRVTGKYKTITTIFDDLDDKIFEVVYYEEFQSYDWFAVKVLSHKTAQRLKLSSPEWFFKSPIIDWVHFT